ncbi:hypothetical protein BH24ACT22_BH24ACT22_04250 [soil metagenome]
MLKTVEAIVEKDGTIRLLENVDLSRTERVLVTILNEDYESDTADAALLSEASLSEDWDREEEDEAWRHLQQAP